MEKIYENPSNADISNLPKPKYTYNFTKSKLLGNNVPEEIKRKTRKNDGELDSSFELDDGVEDIIIPKNVPQKPLSVKALSIKAPSVKPEAKPQSELSKMLNNLVFGNLIDNKSTNSLGRMSFRSNPSDIYNLYKGTSVFNKPTKSTSSKLSKKLKKSSRSGASFMNNLENNLLDIDFDI
jgi:hypothetical protein